MRRAKVAARLVVVVVVSLVFVALGREASAMSIRDAGRLLAKAQRDFFSGKTQEANEQLKQVEAAITAAKAGDNALEQSAAKLLEGRVAGLRRDIDRKLGVTDQAPDKPAAKTDTPPKTDATPATEKLPGGVSHRLKDINTTLEGAEERLTAPSVASTKSRIASAENAARTAKGTMADIEKRYAGQYSPEHPDVVAAQKRIADFEKQIAEKTAAFEKEQAAEAATAAKAEAESAQWIAKLKPYVTSPYKTGHDPEKYFIPGYTEETEDMVKRLRLYTAARADFDAYRKAELGAPNEELQLIVKDLDYSLKTHETNCAEMAKMNLDKAEDRIDYLTKRAETESKKIGTDKLPLPAAKIALQEPRASLDRAKLLLGEDHERLVDLEKRYAAMLALDAKLCEARVAETRMIGDKFTGKETDELKKTAGEIVLKKYPDAKILRATVVSPAWREENVVEWTDTTRTAVRHRITQYVSAQIAGKRGADTKIYTVHIAKNRNADGSWTGLFGHIMFEDPILEENVNK